MDPITFEIRTPINKRREDSQVIRISGANADAIKRISYMTRQPMTAVADRLLEEALKNVQMVEVPLYDLKINE